MTDQTPPAAPSPATPSLPNAPTPIPTGVGTTKQFIEPYGSRGMPLLQAPGGSIVVSLSSAQLDAIITALGAIPSGTAGGDLGGNYPNPVVESLGHVAPQPGTGVLTTFLNLKGFGGGSLIVLNTASDSNNDGNIVVLDAAGNANVVLSGESGILELGTAGTGGGAIQLAGDTSGVSKIKAQAAAGLTTFAVPNTNGTNHFVLQTDGSGNTSWVNGANIPGSVDDARLSANVPLLNAANIFLNNMVIAKPSAFSSLTLYWSDGIRSSTYYGYGVEMNMAGYFGFAASGNNGGYNGGAFSLESTGKIAVTTTGGGAGYCDLKLRHLLGDAATLPPTIAAGTGAGTTPTVSIAGHDMAGVITVLTGTLPAGTNAVIVTITLGTGYGTAQYPMLTPANAVTAALSGASMVFASGGTTTWIITGGTVALAAATTYKWNYSLGGY